MTERGVFVARSTLHRWSTKMLPEQAMAFRRHKLPAGNSWRTDDTYVQVADEWKYRYRAVDGNGDKVDFLLRAKRNHTAARAFFERAIGLHIEMRQSKYLNNLIEPDHRAVKSVTRTMLGFKSFRGARILIGGIEVMHMIRKGQLAEVKNQVSFSTNPFYSLAF